MSNQEKLEFKATDLGKQFRCSELRNKNLLLEQEQNDAFRKAVFIKEEIRNLFKVKKMRKINEDDMHDLKERVKEFFATQCNYKTQRTAELHAVDAYNQICRYVLSEQRSPIFAPTRWVEYAGLRVKVSPDMIFVNGNVIEVVKLKTSKPRIASKSKKKDQGANTSLELYSLFNYGRQMVKVGKEMIVKASIYYLRKNTDKPGEYDAHSDFFDGGGNVVSIEDAVIGNGELICLFGNKPGCEECDGCPYPQMCEYLESTVYCHLDAQFRPQIEEFVSGVDSHECTKEMCESCDFHHVCNFNRPPVVIKHEKTKKSVSDLALTESQEEAVNYRKGICRINAGAGSGKTTIVSLRVAAMLSEGVKPEEVMLVTFTKVAADEMRERIAMYNEDFGNDADVSKIKAVTFNAFGDEIIHEHYTELGFDEDPRLLNNVDRAKYLVKLLNDHPVDGTDYRNFDMNMPNCKGVFEIANQAFAICKKYDLNIGDGKALKDKMYEKRLTRFITDERAYDQLINLYFEYDSMIHTANLFEYEDQIKMVFELLHRDPYFIEDMGVKHIIVDEFQDSNLSALELIKELRNTKVFQSLMVVGDDSQAIYSFNDTTPDYIINFFDYMEEIGDDIYLLENHRSTPEIIEFANKINDLNTVKVAKSLVATRPSGKPVIARGFIDPEDEYGYIVDGIADHIKNGSKLNDIAFIGRNAAQLQKVGTLLSERGIEWIMLSPEGYLENSRVIAAIDFLKAVESPTATKCYLPYLNCLLDGKLMEKNSSEILALVEDLKSKIESLKALPDVKTRKTVLEWLRAIDCDDEIYQKFLEQLEWSKTLSDMIVYAIDYETFGTQEKTRRLADYNGVVLTTAHSSKGLEWPVVYNSISLYYSEAEEKKKMIQEESRRLLFVSATRARDELIVTGQYIAKNGMYNLFLKECYGILGMEFAPPTSDEIKAHRLQKAKEKEAQELSAA